MKSEAQVKGYPTWTVPAQALRPVCDRLRTKFSFDYLDMVTAVDWPASAGAVTQVAASAPAALIPFSLTPFLPHTFSRRA